MQTCLSCFARLIIFMRYDLKTLTFYLDVTIHLKISSLLERIITLHVLDGEAISDTSFLQEPTLCNLFEWN